MARYLIQTWHTPSECLPTLIEAASEGEDKLSLFDFVCAAPSNPFNHSAYVVVEAENETAARRDLPAIMQSRATVIEIAKVTLADVDRIRKGHTKA